MVIVHYPEFRCLQTSLDRHVRSGMRRTKGSNQVITLTTPNGVCAEQTDLRTKADRVVAFVATDKRFLDGLSARLGKRRENKTSAEVASSNNCRTRIRRNEGTGREVAAVADDLGAVTSCLCGNTTDGDGYRGFGVTEIDPVLTSLTLNGGGAVPTCVNANGVVTGPPLNEDVLLIRKETLICHERLEEQKSYPSIL